MIPRHKLGIFLQIPSEEICRASGYKIVTSEGAVYVKCEVERVTYKLHKGINKMESRLRDEYGMA